MNEEKKKYYEKTTDLLLSVFRKLCGNDSFLRKEDISDRKNRILIKEYGSAFSRDNVLFCDKFLVFAPSFIATYDSLRSQSFNTDVAHKNFINFKDINGIYYELMPCQTSIQIITEKGSSKELFDGVPNPETYAGVASYENAVQDGTYKARTICYLSCIYALTALHRCSSGEYEKTYLKVEDNIKRLVEYQKDTNDHTKKYGGFFSFDFVTCKYDPNIVEKALAKIASVKMEVREDEAAERREHFAQTLGKKMEETRQQYEK